MTTARSSGSRRTVLAATLAATAGLVGGMALKTVAPAPSSASTPVTNATSPSLGDQNATGVWVGGHDDDGYGDGEHESEGEGERSGRVFQPATPPPAGNVGGRGPVLSSHGS